MSPRRHFLLFILVSTLHAAASDPAVIVFAGDAVTDSRAIKRLHEIHERPGDPRGSDAHFDFILRRARALRERGLEFIAAHPTHPLRWDVLVLLQHSGNLEIRTRADGSRFAAQPAAEHALWRQEYLGRLEDLLESTDAGRAARHEALLQLIDYYCQEIRSARIDNPRRGLVPSLLEWVTELHSFDSRSNRLSTLYLRVARMLNAFDPNECLTFLDEKEALHPGDHYVDVDVRRHIGNFRRLVRNQQDPAVELWEHLRRIEPALDPAAYRGQVVLIARLAVDWTSYTRQFEELYRKYHADGLEIIHLAYQNRGVERVADGTGTNTRIPPLVQRDKAVMERYVAEKKWPWPVLWEVATLNNGFQTVWGLNSIPAFIIVRRDGRIAREIPGELGLDLRIAREVGVPGRR